MALPIADIRLATKELLQRLVGQPETESLEFKRDPYGRDDQAKREFCKDVCALANTRGGDLIIGIEEADHQAIALVGLPSAAAGDEIQRLQHLLLDAIEPRILGVQFQSVDLGEDASAVIIRVPRSLDLPHRVRQNNSNRFFVRHSDQAVEASMLELRRMFELSGSEFDHAEEFRAARVARLAAHFEPYRLDQKENGVVILHLIPFGYSARSVGVDLSMLQDGTNWIKFIPALHQSASKYFCADGLVVHSAGGDIRSSYTVLSRTGTLEAARSNIFLSQRHNDRPVIGAHGLANELSTGVAQYVSGLLQLGAVGPWIALATLWNCVGAEVTASKTWEWASFGQPIVDRELVLPGVVVDERHASQASAREVLRPMFDALWQVGGQPHMEAWQ